MKSETPARPSPKGSKKAKAVPKGSHRDVPPAEPMKPVADYRGLIALALSSGEVTSMNVQAVHRNDRFDYAYGLDERLEHVPAEGERGDVTHFYAYARFKNGGYHFAVLSRAEVDAVRSRSEGSAWGRGYAELGKEMAVRRIAQYLPLDLPQAAVLEDWGEIAADPAEPVPRPGTAAPAEGPALQQAAPQAVDLTEDELAGLFPPGHIMRILDAAAERGMPDEVLDEIAGMPIDEVCPEDESAILRIISSWQR